jgi:hypothetical protein
MRRIAHIVAVATAGLALGACSADDARNAVVDQCLREAERIDNPSARAAAEKGCRAAQDGSLDTEDAKRAARERCLEKAGDIANAAARREAERGCEEIR